MTEELKSSAHKHKENWFPKRKKKGRNGINSSSDHFFKKNHIKKRKEKKRHSSSVGV